MSSAISNKKWFFLGLLALFLAGDATGQPVSLKPCKVTESCENLTKQMKEIDKGTKKIEQDLQELLRVLRERNKSKEKAKQDP